MKAISLSGVLMVFATNVWAVYGVGLAPRAVSTFGCEGCQERKATPTSSNRPRVRTIDRPEPPQSDGPIPTTFTDAIHLAVDTRVAPLPPQTDIIPSDTPTFGPPRAPAGAETISETGSTPTLSAHGAVGIGVGISATVLFFALLVVGFPHYRQWRRSRALKRALKEVESGIQIQQDKACAVADGVNVPTGACAKPVNDNMVLESRVEIIVEEDKSDAGGDAVRSWNGWDARGSLEGEGRKGMSLPRKTE